MELQVHCKQESLFYQSKTTSSVICIRHALQSRLVFSKVCLLPVNIQQKGAVRVSLVCFLQ